MHNFSLYDMFERNARVHKDRIALTDETRQMSFEVLLMESQALAAGLSEQGVGRGDRIAVLAHNDYRFFLIFGAAAALGAVVVPINWRLAPEEIGYILADCEPAMLVTDGAHATKAREILGENASLAKAHYCFGDNCQGLPALDDLKKAGGRVLPAEVSQNEPYCIIYTAAMGGKPNGAMLSHGNLIFANLQAAATMGISPDDAYLNMLPIFHITGLNLAFTVMHAGGKNVVVERFDARQTLEKTQSERISVLGSFPPILSRLSEELDRNTHDVSSLRHVFGLDGPDNIQPFEEKTGATFWILYGQTETSGLVTFSPALERAGSAGKQGMLTKVAIVDEGDRLLPVGETGEIVVRGPLVFQGYWRQESLNLKTFRNGWHHTGDLGRLDADGYLWFGGRKPEKELIKPGGENVYPAEVEEVILSHPAVAAVSVIGVPDPQFGEGIKAVCQLESGQSLSLEALAEYVAERIARYKKPRYAQFVAELPKKADGTVDREKVKSLYGKA